MILCLPEEGVNLRPHPGHSITGDTLPDSQNIAFARDDDYFFGVLHSRAHEVWSLRMGTSLEDRPRYTPTTCFEMLPNKGP